MRQIAWGTAAWLLLLGLSVAAQSTVAADSAAAPNSAAAPSTALAAHPEQPLGHTQPGPAAAAAAGPMSNAESAAASAGAEYKLGPDDLLNIEVWHEPDISGKVPVRPDGKISVPLVGEVQAAGKTALQLQQVITDRLKAYLDQPAVTVVVEEVNSRKVNVLGRVLHPGTYSLGTHMRVLDALAMAGGPVIFAHLSDIYVLRSSAGHVQKLPFNYKDVLKGKDINQNVELQPGDTVVIP